MPKPISAGLKVTAIPVLRDNYVWCLDNGRQAYLVDPGEAAPVATFLQQNALTLAGILLTHHHRDHVGGVAELLDQFDSAISQIDVYGPAVEAISETRQPLRGGETLQVLGFTVQVMSVAAHTRGHLAYYLPTAKALFSGDTLFGAGCGRLFEGSGDDLFAALSCLRDLPDETQIYCAHEYTEANLRFAQAVEPKNAAITQRIIDTARLRVLGQPSVPSLLGLERETNPFLRWDTPTVSQAAQWFDPSAKTDVSILAAVRRWKDAF